MMISPEVYIDDLKEKTYEELLIEKEKLLNSINEFENNGFDAIEIVVDPSPEVVYQCNLLYLSKLCELIVEKFRDKSN